MRDRRKTNGGPREGSGRKFLNKQQVTIRVTHETYAFLRVQATIDNTNISQVIEKLVNKEEEK